MEMFYMKVQVATKRRAQNTDKEGTTPTGETHQAATTLVTLARGRQANGHICSVY
jgi:hypothetical protein